MSRPNVTMIQDLPDLNDLENSYGSSSGMSALTPEQTRVSKNIRQHTREAYNNIGRESSLEMNAYNNRSNQPQIYYEEPVQKEYFDPTPAPVKLNCLDVCSHIASCPLCSKFYHNDNTLLIIIIVALLILVVILTRKVLNL